MKNNLIFLVIPLSALTFETVATAPPVSGDGAFGCSYRNLVYGDYIPKQDKAIEVCKVRGGYTFTFGKYDSINTEGTFFPAKDVTIANGKVILKSKDVNYTLNIDRDGTRTLKRTGDYTEENDFGNDTFNMLDSTGKFTPPPPVRR